MTIRDSSSDGMEGAGERAGGAEYRGQLPDLTISDHSASDTSRGKYDHRAASSSSDIGEPLVRNPNTIVPERTASTPFTTPSETTNSIGSTAASAAVEIPEPPVVSRAQPETPRDAEPDVTHIRDAASRAPLAGLLGRDAPSGSDKAEPKDAFRAPNDFVTKPKQHLRTRPTVDFNRVSNIATTRPDTAESPREVRMPIPVVAVPENRWVRETDPGDQPAATGVEVISTATIAYDIPHDLRAGMLPAAEIRAGLFPSAHDIDPDAPQEPQSPRVIEGTLVQEPETHTETTTEPGQSEAAPSDNASMAPGASWPEELAVITKGAVVTEAPVRGIYTPENLPRAGNSEAATGAGITETSIVADSRKTTTEVEQNITQAETPDAQANTATPEPTNDASTSNSETTAEVTPVTTEGTQEVTTEPSETPPRTRSDWTRSDAPRRHNQIDPSDIFEPFSSDPTQLHNATNSADASTRTTADTSEHGDTPHSHEPAVDNPNDIPAEVADAPETPDEASKFQRFRNWFSGKDRPTREEALESDDPYSYARPTPRERTVAAGAAVGTAALAPVRAFFGSVESVEKVSLGHYTVKITRGGRTKLVQVAAPGKFMAKIAAHIKTAFS